MTRAVTLATLGLCAAVALISPRAADAATDPDYTTWLFAEGSTSPVLGFEEELLLANPNGTPAQVTIAIYTQDGVAIAPFGPIPIAPRSRTGLNVRSLPGVGDQSGVALRVTADLPIIAERTMYWGGGFFRNSRPNSAVISDLRGGHNEKGANAGARTWYFAEGEAKFFSTFVSVANPGATPANVTATYRDDEGVEYVETAQVAPNARHTFWPNVLLSGVLQPGRAGFATTITSDVDVVAERQMYWGPGAPFGIRGGHAAMGVTTPSATWLFAEGIQGSLAPGGDPSYDTFVLLFNQSASPIDVTVEFFGQAGVKLAEVTRSVKGLARDGVWAREFAALHNQAFSIRATSASPFVAERAVYWRGLTEGHATAGATAPSLKWGFAEGLQGGFRMYQDSKDVDKRRFNTFFPIYNPGTTPANVTVHFYAENGEEGNLGVTKTVSVPAQSRETIWTLLHDELANAKFSTFFDSDQPIVVERVVYWGANNKAGHASIGTPLPSTFVLTPAPNVRTAPSGVTLTLSPARGVPSGGTSVEIEGSGFGHTELGTQVLFGGVPAASFEVENDNTIRAVTPAGALGKVDVTVITRGQTITAPQAFEYFDKNAAGPAKGYGNEIGLVESIAAGRPFDLFFSCTEHGSPHSNTFMFEVVASLRKKYQTNRWGLNWKRGNVGDLSQDIVNYYTGPEGTTMRNSTQVRLFDIIGGHCGSRPSPFWVDQTAATRNAGTVGRWTSDPMCNSARYRDAKFDNGEWMFPECRP